MTRYATIPTNGRFVGFGKPGERFALALGELFGAGTPHLLAMVVDPDGHPLDTGALAVLDAERVEEARDALTEWLERTA